MDDETLRWLPELVAGDESAIRGLWDRYHEGLLRIARQRLGERRRRSADEEDVVLSAFKSFCLGAAAGRYPNLDDRQSVWKLLLTITLRKANAELKRQFAQKRGGGCVVGESVFVNETSSAPGLAGIADDQLRPDLAAMMNAQCQQLLDSLEDKTLQRIALGKLEGYTNQELAIELNCSLPTIERKLQKIRRQWGRELENGPGT